MNPDNTGGSRTTLNWLGVIGAFVFMVVLVSALKHYSTVPSVNLARAQERRKFLAETREKSAVELNTAGWIDREKGVVRLPNEVAIARTVELWQDPAKAREVMLERAGKAFFIPPPPPEKPSEFE